MAENPFKTVVVTEKPKLAATKNVKSRDLYKPYIEKMHQAKQLVAEKTETPETIDLSKLRVGTIVISNKYGEGKITGFKPGKILVSFSEELKSFLIPMAFEQGYLKNKEW